MCHETVLEQTEQEAEIECTDEAKTESTTYSQAKTRAMETASSSNSAPYPANICVAAAA